MRVPCIARLPGTILPGSTCSEIATMMDWLPTLATLCGGRLQDGRVIDGHDITPLLTAEPDAAPAYESFAYYSQNSLYAVRSGPWKLHLGRHDDSYIRWPVLELYNLSNDIGETEDLSASHPDIVENLQAIADGFHLELGDSLTGVTGRGVRPAGRVENPSPLTHYSPDHPYIVGMYDLPDKG